MLYRLAEKLKFSSLPLPDLSVLGKEHLLKPVEKSKDQIKLFSPGEMDAFKASTSPSQCSETQKKDILVALQTALKFNRVEIFAQPIVTIPNRHPWAIELYGRLRNRPGEYIPASRYFSLAKEYDLLEELDNKVLLKALETIQLEIKKNLTKNAPKPFFINIGRQTLTDTGFMHMLLQFLSRFRALSSLIILEIAEKDILHFDDKKMEILEGLHRIGCRISIGSFTSGEIDLKRIKDCKADYLKIPASYIVKKVGTSEKARKSMYEQMEDIQSRGIELIAEHVESRAELATLLDLPIEKAQGYLLGKPASPGVYNIPIAA